MQNRLYPQKEDQPVTHSDTNSLLSLTSHVVNMKQKFENFKFLDQIAN